MHRRTDTAPKPFMRKLDFTKLNQSTNAVYTIKEEFQKDGMEDSRIQRHDQALVNMIQNEESAVINSGPDGDSSRKFGYGF